MNFRSLARQLANARRNGGRVEVNTLARSLDVKTAYAIQHQVLRISSDVCVGYKVGATTLASMDLLRLAEPFHGPLLERHCHPSGCQIAAPSFQHVLVEAEISVKLGADLPLAPAGYNAEQVSAAIEWIAPAIELCSFRFNAELNGNGALLIADGGINMDFVCGDPIFKLTACDLLNRPVALQKNGAVVANGNTNILMTGHPFGLVAWLANAPFLRHGGLHNGDLISTGSCTGLTAVEPGDQVAADFGDLGRVEVQLT